MGWTVKEVLNDGTSTGEYEWNGDDYWTFEVLTNETGDEVHEVSRKSDTPPNVGQEYSVRDHKNTDYPPKLKKPVQAQGAGGARKGGGGGGKGGGGYSPQDIAAMRRSNAQEKALRFCELRGLLPFVNTGTGEVELRGPENMRELDALIGWFEADVAEAASKAPAS